MRLVSDAISSILEAIESTLYFSDFFSDTVISGLLVTDTALLVGSTSAGIAYVSGERVKILVATSVTYEAIYDTYVDINSDGEFQYTAVENGEATPDVATDSIRLAKVICDATEITSVTDLRTINVAFSIASTIVKQGDALNAHSLAGTLTVGEYAVQLNASLSADGKYSGITCDGVIGYASAAFGELVYLATGDGRWEKTDADAEATAGDVELAMVISSGSSDGDGCVILKYGYIREDDWNWTSPGDTLYIDTATAGGMTATRPSGSSDIVRVVGYQQPDTNTILFDPSKSWVEIA